MKNFIIFILLVYKKYISPFLGKHCRFYPSCSEYAIMAVNKYGIIHGIAKSFLRVLKCHPLNPGGVDFP